jgi:hypothetical protein
VVIVVVVVSLGRKGRKRGEETEKTYGNADNKHDLERLDVRQHRLRDHVLAEVPDLEWGFFDDGQGGGRGVFGEV